MLRIPPALATLCCLLLSTIMQAADLSPAEARAIAKEAYIYGYPMVDSYRINFGFYLLPGNPEYKAPLNQLVNLARLTSPDDTTVQTPNSDTPYSFFGGDLRAEPLVVTVPEMDQARYYSIQFIDAYTHNFAYLGSRTTGNGAGHYLLAGPSWKGEKPSGITSVIACETNLMMAIYRTQLFDAQDMEQVKKIQASYQVRPLSAFLGQAAPPAPPTPTYVQPYAPATHKESLQIFSVLNFVLTFCPTVPSETELMARFAKIGVGAGKPFDVAALSPELKQALADGVADAWKEFNTFKSTEIDTGKITSGQLFGTRDYLKNNYLYRMAAAILGIYGNSMAEAMYPIYSLDADSKKLDGTTQRYLLHFAKDALPPVHAFWSLTMYSLPDQLLVKNPLNRYLLNSPMLPTFVRDSDGGLTLYVQHESPGKEREANWLPAPKGPFFAVMRLYRPQDTALNGTWKAPKLTPIK